MWLIARKISSCFEIAVSLLFINTGQPKEEQPKSTSSVLHENPAASKRARAVSLMFQ